MYRLIVLGSLYVKSDALWVFIDPFFRLVTTSTNSPLQFVGFVLKLGYRQFCSNQSWRMYENACDRIEKK